MTNRRHGLQTVVYVDGYDLSADSNNFEPADTYDDIEVSGYQQRKEHIPGQGEGRIAYRGWFNRNANKSHQVLSARNGTNVNIAASWGNAVGDPGVAGSAALMTSYQETAPVAGAVAVSAEFIPDDDAVDWIQTLLPKGTLAAAGAAKDDGAGSNAGMRAYAHIFEILGGTPAISIEHSVSGTADWASLIAFTAGTVVAGRSGASTGTVRQFVRATVANGSATAFIGYKRL